MSPPSGRGATGSHLGGKTTGRLPGSIVPASTSSAVTTAPGGRHVATADRVAVPQVILTDPEIASVGHAVAAAKAAGLTVRTVEYDLGEVAGAALHADGYRRHASILIDEQKNTIVGFTAVRPGVAELVDAATIAITG
jgi:dihydrolipoamide dehydrogenase